MKYKIIVLTIFFGSINKRFALDKLKDQEIQQKNQLDLAHPKQKAELLPWGQHTLYKPQVLNGNLLFLPHIG